MGTAEQEVMTDDDCVDPKTAGQTGGPANLKLDT